MLEFCLNWSIISSKFYIRAKTVFYCLSRPESLSFLVPKLLKVLPSSIKNSTSLRQFKFKFNTWIAGQLRLQLMCRMRWENSIYLICSTAFTRLRLCHLFSWHLYITFPSCALFSGIVYRNESACILFNYFEIFSFIYWHTEILGKFIL